MSPPLVGLVPAAGRGTRIAPLPGSKELFCVGFDVVDGLPRPTPVCAYLLRSMARAGVRTAYVVVGDGKWDIPAYLGDGAPWGLDLAYLTIRASPGAPFTVDRAYSHVRGRRVAFGFPDIVLRPDDALARVAARQERSGADVVLGLFRADRPEKVDMVEVDADGRVQAIVIKPATTSLELTWLLAVWGPAFTEHLHDFVAARRGAAEPVELHVGDAVRAAIAAGLRVEGERLADGRYRDIGTPEDLRAAVRELA